MKMKIIIFFLVFFNYLHSQEAELNEYGLFVCGTHKSYVALIQKDSSKLFVDIDIIPGIRKDIRYATRNNFYGSPVYEEQKAFLRLPAALSLAEIQEELLKQNKCLKIFDAYRPYSVTVLFYQKIKDTNFVASAWTGSRHNRGCAVDLTIVDLKTGRELEMPTPYDDFSDKAAADYKDITPEEKTNRDLLQSLMQKHGFILLKSEWWHFDYYDWKKYELADLSFSELEKTYTDYKEKILGWKTMN